MRSRKSKPSCGRNRAEREPRSRSESIDSRYLHIRHRTSKLSHNSTMALPRAQGLLLSHASARENHPASFTPLATAADGQRRRSAFSPCLTCRCPFIRRLPPHTVAPSVGRELTRLIEVPIEKSSNPQLPLRSLVLPTMQHPDDRGSSRSSTHRPRFPPKPRTAEETTISRE